MTKKEDKPFEERWAYIMEEHGIDSFEIFLENCEKAYEDLGKYKAFSKVSLGWVIDELKDIRDAKVIFQEKELLKKLKMVQYLWMHDQDGSAHNLMVDIIKELDDTY